MLLYVKLYIYLSPLPLRITVSYFEISTLPAVPKMLSLESSRVTPTYYEITVAPVKQAISFKIAFLLSPNEGAFTAQT